MTREAPSLEQHHAGGALELVLEQRPFLGGWWTLVGYSQVIAFLLFFLAVFHPSPPPGLWWLLAWFVAAMFVHLAGNRFRRPARLTVTPTVLSVEACTGRLAWPRTVVLSLDRIVLEHARTVSVEERKLHQLTLTDGEHTCTVPGLACTTEELDRVRAVVSAAADHARAVQGDGEAEVPAALRGFLRAGRDRS